MTRFKTLLSLAIASFSVLHAEDFDLNVKATAGANGGTEEFAPYYIMSNRHGKVTSGRGAMLEASLWHDMDSTKRFSYAFGLEASARAGNDIDYDRYYVDTKTWQTHPHTTSDIWLSQLYGQIKYRSLYLTAGIKDFESKLLNHRLSSGDLVESGNARAMPGARAGFIDFVDIPLTKGWLQIQGEIAYAKSTDNRWVSQRYNHYNYLINQGWWYNYKRMLFRTKPTEPISITLGLQAAAQFGGTSYQYRDPKRPGEISGILLGDKLRFRHFLEMIVLREGDAFVVGNHVGAWDFQARYRLRNNNEIRAYFQWLWEDGTGIGKLNGLDGLWGLEWKPARRGAISGAVVEVLTFMNQSGPMHYDYDDLPGSTLRNDRAGGADNYYNNFWYNGYAYYGMSIGSPMFLAPVYNTDGAVTQFLENRFWGIHGAVEGDITPMISYRLMANYRRYFGTMFIPALNPTHSVSFFAEAAWTPQSLPGFSFNAQVGLDTGNSLLPRTFGAMIGVTYSGIIKCKSKFFKPCVF